MDAKTTAIVMMEMSKLKGEKFLAFHVPGRPISKLRSRGGQGRGGRVRTPKALTEYKIKVAQIADGAIQALKRSIIEVECKANCNEMKHDSLIFEKGEKVKMTLLFVYKNHQWEGDVDNLQGSIMDALNGVDLVAKKDCIVNGFKVLRGDRLEHLGKVWHDDKQVVASLVQKVFLSEPEGEMLRDVSDYQEGVYVTLEPYPDHGIWWSDNTVVKTLAFQAVYQ